MRTAFLLASSFAVPALALAVACASSEDEEPRSYPPESSPVLDAAAPDAPAAPEDDGAVVLRRCSPAGWCMTDLPDADLVLRDITPFPKRAFAVAESASRGVKVLEWEEATNAWKYIDDGTQSEFELGPYVGTMWAPSENEVYFTIAPGTVYHGTRSAPEAAWTWSRHRLVDHAHEGEPTHSLLPAHDHGYPRYDVLKGNYPALGVWGTGSDDVYAWYSNTIFHLRSDDGGTPEWTPEYVADDTDAADEHLYIFAAGGRRNDVWFSGGRSRQWVGCALLLRKTPDGIVRVADSTTDTTSSDPCRPREGSLLIGGTRGWLTDIQSLGGDSMFGLKGGRDVVGISMSGDEYTVRSTTIPVRAMTPVQPAAFYSFWGHATGVWLSGWSQVVGGDITDVDAGASAYALSTVSLSGAPLDAPLYRVRGTSSSNLWAIGAGYALHKTTP